MGTPRIRNQEHSITCAAEDARFDELLRAFFAALLPEQPLKTALEPKNREKTLTDSEALFHRERVPLRMHG